MGEVPWEDLFAYGFSVLAFLILLFAPTLIDTGEPSNLEKVQIIDFENRSYADAQNLTVTVSGQTDLTHPDSSLVINSSNYDKKQSLLEVQLTEERPESLNLSSQNTVSKNYTVKAGFRETLPDQVIVSGTAGRTEAFKP